MKSRRFFRQVARSSLQVLVAAWICIQSVAIGATPMDPFVIVRVLSQFTIPRVVLRNATIDQALKFYAAKYHDVDGDPRETDFVFDVRLPNNVLQRRVSIEAEEISLLDVLRRTFKDIPVAITLESGKVILSSSPVFPDAKSAPAKP